MKYLVLGLMLFTSIGMAAPRTAVQLGWKRSMYTFDALDDDIFDIDLAQEVVGADPSVMTFSSDNLPDWLEIKGNHLQGFPDVDVLHVPVPFTLTVTTSHGVASVPAQIQVMYAITTAVWTAATIQLPNAVVGQNYSVDLSKYVSNPDQDLVDYDSLHYPPAWLQLSEDGILSGTPTASDLGNVTLTLDAWGSQPQPGPSQSTATFSVVQ